MTSNNGNEKPREFWIVDFKIGPDESISQNVLVCTSKTTPFLDSIHVISIDAYRELERKLEVARKIIDDQNKLLIKYTNARDYTKALETGG